MPLHTFIPYWSVLEMFIRLVSMMGITMMWTMVLWIFMMMHMLLHICKHVKFHLDWYLRKGIMLCIGQNNSNGKVIPFYGCGQMDKWRLCFTHNNVTTLWSMFMKSWAILGFNKFIQSYFVHNIGGEGCNCKFNNLFIVYGVWPSSGIF